MTFTLNEHEIKVLPVLLMSRVATSLVMGLYSHHFKADDTVSDNNEEKDKEEEFQDNTAYLLKSQQTGWNILKAFVQETRKSWQPHMQESLGTFNFFLCYLFIKKNRTHLSI